MMMRENEKSMRTLAMLRYQADRYQSVGNGSMCQRDSQIGEPNERKL